MNGFDKIAIMGAGAMGTLLGAVLTAHGKNVELIDVDTEQVRTLCDRGAIIAGTVSMTVPVRAVTADKMSGVYDLVFLLVKQKNSRQALETILPHIHGKSVVCTLQNGLPEQVVEEYLGLEKTMGCAVTWAATAAGPGVIRSTAALDSWHQSLGRSDGKITDEVLAVADILNLMCSTKVTDNLTGIRWSKLLVNSSLSGVSAVLGCTFGGLLSNEGALRCAQKVARECVRTARALGVRMAPLAPGEDFDTLMDYCTEEERRQKSRIFFELLGSSENPGKSSMLQDLERGRPSEVDYINGLILSAASSCNVPAPYCTWVVEMIHEIEAGKRRPGMENLGMLVFNEIN